MPLHDRKIVDFPSPTPNPSPISRDPGDGVNRSKVNSFPEQHQHKPTKTIVPGQARFQIFLSEGGGGGPGSSAYFTEYIKRGWGPMFFTHFPGRVQLFPGGGVQMLISIETHITTTCDFPGDPLSPPPLDSHMGNVEFRHESVRPPFKLINSKC